jgi:hypothetical protein
MNFLTKAPVPEALGESRAKEIARHFAPMLEKAQELESKFNEIVSMPLDDSAAAAARALRLEMRQIRIAVEKKHKEEKKAFLEGGRYIDSLKNVYLATAGEKEAKLKEIEGYRARMEAERIQKLQEEREVSVSQYLSPEEIPGNLGEMDDSRFPPLFRRCEKGAS